MRRLIASLACLGLLGATVGCEHTAGVCDCDSSGYGCACCDYGAHGEAPVLQAIGAGTPLPGRPVEAIPAPAGVGGVPAPLPISAPK